MARYHVVVPPQGGPWLYHGDADTAPWIGDERYRAQTDFLRINGTMERVVMWVARDVTSEDIQALTALLSQVP